MANPKNTHYIDHLGGELLPTVKALPGVNLTAYLTTIHHQLANTTVQQEPHQIAADRPRTLPQRLFLATRINAVRHSQWDAIATAAWIVCWQRTAGRDTDFALSDPLDHHLLRGAWQSADALETVEAFCKVSSIFESKDETLLGPEIVRQLGAC